MRDGRRLLKRALLLALRALMLSMLVDPAMAVAGIPLKVEEDTLVFRVDSDGKPYVAGKLSVGEKIDLVGYRPDYDWVRIRYEDDEGYVLKENIEESDLQRPYFDPAADKLGRRRNAATYELAVLTAKKRRAPRLGLVGNLAFHSSYGAGAGAGLVYRAFSWERSGYDVGIDGVFHFSHERTPFIGYLFYRYWTAGELKLGFEGYLSSTTRRALYVDEVVTSTLGGGGGIYLGIPFLGRSLLTPGVRLNLWGEVGAVGVLAIGWNL